MKKLFAVLFFSFFGFGCNPSNQSTEARSEELPITINPVIERVFLKIDSAVFPDIEVAIHWNGTKQICDGSSSECLIELPLNQTVDIEIVPKDKRFLLDTWGLIDCSKNSLLCRLNMTDNLTLKIKGQNAISLHDDFIEFSRADRSTAAGSDLLPAEISLPDRIFLSKGIAANKRVIFKFESGSCVYDGNIDICGVAHCDPTKVLTLRSCEINDQKYKYLVDGSGYFDLPEPVRLKEVQLQGRLKLEEIIELSFEFPVHEWKYDENDFENQNILN